MRIRVDRSRCSGHALCNSIEPRLFLLDDDGYSSLDVVDVAEELEGAAQRGADVCPERAITIER